MRGMGAAAGEGEAVSLSLLPGTDLRKRVCLAGLTGSKAGETGRHEVPWPWH